MRILYITPGCFDKGGISRYNRYQIRAFSEIYGSDKVRVLSLAGPASNSFEEPIKVHWHGTSSFMISKILLVWQMFKAIIFWKADVIHVAHVNFSGVAVLLGKMFRRKVILNVYGLEVWSGLSWDASYGLINCHSIISDCHNTADYIKGNFKSHPDIVVIWDCVDIEKFHETHAGDVELAQRYNLPDRNENFVVLTLGRMSPGTAYKGYVRLLDVVHNVVQHVPNICLVYAGSGSLVQELSEKANKLGLTDRVFFTGAIREQDLPGIYSYAHVFSLVTQSGKDMGEGIPLTPLEAMACGKPILVGNQDGSREAVFGDQNGFVIDPLDLSAHAERIIRLASNTLLLREMSSKAIQIVNQHFNYLVFKDAHRKAYEDWMNQS